MPICKKIFEQETKAKTNYTASIYEKSILFIIVVGFIALLFGSCTPANKVHCNGNKRMAIYNSGGYR